MTAPTLIDGLTPPVGSEVVSTASMLGRRFPSAVVWFGAFTQRWWAIVRAGDRWSLVEGAGPDELTGAIINANRR
ncbi:hypothetical protein NE236_36930 [Actinoallomurus purpureus]|uniref:hypothetical protein n=1 Tax=Actinoallomurus purpureus TaxID=478114 RepID=UPI002092B59C|nr:hypothetical protein [Actinoallomurus purpureus]MCO6010558.1 hypothetical protein [Actinoallomurus purpureus]